MMGLVKEHLTEERRECLLLMVVTSTDGGHRRHDNIARPDHIELCSCRFSSKHAYHGILNVGNDAEPPEKPILAKLVCGLLTKRVSGNYDKYSISARLYCDG